MLRKLSLAIAISGLLVASIPSTVAASSGSWVLTGHANCFATSVDLSVTWTGGTGHWVNFRAIGDLTDATGVTLDQSSARYTVLASDGGTDLVVFQWGTTQTPVSYSMSVQLLHGGGTNPIGSPYTFSGTCSGA